MKETCIPVPGMPGCCTIPPECERCINERLDAVEHEAALLDVDIETMRREIDEMTAAMKRVSRGIDRQSREIAAVMAGTGCLACGTDDAIQRAERNAVNAIAMIETMKKMETMIKSIIVHVT